MSSSQQMHRGGETHSLIQERTEQLMESARESGHMPPDQMGHAAQSTKESAQENMEPAQENKESAAGFLQQTGEQMKNMAQGAVESVKNTLGVGDSQSQN
ncbi:hypothetical protein MRB53_015796 [Persea americana]|uniref:Uncharacterized protein n=1 Tax=Persea americana TaxID=3435 RepID=A0ACC2M046_PERAE|nr:hypothetical protein MRB53_015796 [Persea americana]